MDTFFEQIIVRKPKAVELVFRALMIATGVLAVIVMLFIATFRLMGAFSGFFVPLAFGLGVGLYFALKSSYVEYEYSLTNGYFDIDKIIGKRKRKRMISTSCAKFEEFGSYDENKQRLASRQFDTKILAANLMDNDLYYAVVRHKDLGAVLIVIQPDERVKTGLKKFMPRQVQKDVLSRD
ncbi:MAG: hypothetical protein IJF54_04175 [Clostridia bacterium]|nr:hypothetical protein [Clostridia bacterium]